MNKIKSTLFTFAGQLLLACAAALLAQPAAQAQTNVNVINTPTVRIDSRGNGVTVLNSQADPVKVRVIEEPFQLVFIENLYGVPEKCSPIPIPQGRVVVIEQLGVIGYKVKDVVLSVTNKRGPSPTDYLSFRGIEVPMSQNGNGLVQLKLHVKGLFNNPDQSADASVAVGDFYNPQICFKDSSWSPDDTSPKTVRVLISGRLLPQ